MVYLNTTNIRAIRALLDTGDSTIRLISFFVDQMSETEKQVFRKEFNCSEYLDILPKINIGLKDKYQQITITIPSSKLYLKRKSNPLRCSSLIRESENESYDLLLGLPFFASAYVEMTWKDTRTTKNPSHWEENDFLSTVTLRAK